MRRYLVIANQTLASEELLKKTQEYMDAGPCAFYIVVPATRSKGGLTWTEGEARAIARTRLDKALRLFRDLGADVDGEVGDENPLLAVSDALLQQPFDELIISTLPPGLSRWLRQDIPHRVERTFGSLLDLTVLTGARERAGVS